MNEEEVQEPTNSGIAAPDYTLDAILYRKKLVNRPKAM